jgi:hypothetical protein
VEDLDREALELAVRKQVLQLAGAAVEQRLNADTSDERGSPTRCACGQEARLAGRRSKRVHSVLGPLQIERAYYHCSKCGHGFCPRDEHLGIEKRTTYGTEVEAGFKFVRYHDNCIFLRAFFVSGDFFLGLKQVETPEGKQFAKGKQIYHNFPDSIVVDVQADVIPCDTSTQRLPSPDIASGLLSTLSFTAGWRTNNADLQSSVVVPTQI